MKQPKPYVVRTLIRGPEIGRQDNSLWVAVPDSLSGGPVLVRYGLTAMLIKDWRKEAVEFRRFRDRFWKQGSKRKQIYTLGYFKYIPEKVLDI